ncbi:hypothetical protein NKH64_30000 [Mesorhizobium sp. M0999]|uniref:hypothetical protein n=1 Tax=Mesorhizobium sp. M0999 TaxID=2957045 RepID=UPI0033358A45
MHTQKNMKVREITGPHELLEWVAERALIRDPQSRITKKALRRWPSHAEKVDRAAQPKAVKPDTGLQAVNSDSASVSPDHRVVVAVNRILVLEQAIPGETVAFFLAIIYLLPAAGLSPLVKMMMKDTSSMWFRSEPQLARQAGVRFLVNVPAFWDVELASP